jgi:hypothetical protein
MALKNALSALFVTIATLSVLASPSLAGGRGHARREYNPFSVHYEHRTARMAREQGASRAMIYNGTNTLTPSWAR